MKKLLILLAAMAILLAGCVNTLEADSTAAATTPGVTATIDPAATFVPQPKEPAQLSEEIFAKIKQTTVGYLDGKRVEDLSFDYDNFTIGAYYGTYNGCVAFYLPGGPYPWVVEETVAGYRFIYPSGSGGFASTAVVWKDDILYTLTDAYGQGLLTEEDIQNIAYYHAEQFPYLYED